MVMSSIITASQAQKNRKASKKEAATTGYAITALEKGGRNWREVKLVDVTTGAEVKSVYESKSKTDALNARTGNVIAKKDQSANSKSPTSTVTYTTTSRPERIERMEKEKPAKERIEKKVVNLDEALSNRTVNVRTHFNTDVHTNINTNTHTRVIVVRQAQQSGDQPFSTNSAAAALDRKHDRLYYTPMNIAQLRYIDLKSGKIYYFEGETFGALKHSGDVQNQITRMVFGSDGNGYALTNSADHLIRFTTGKNPTITDLGSLTDDPANVKSSVHSSGGYGGDMVADAKGSLYLITANRNVFKINIETKVATHLGAIQGLPRGFSTNGAMVEEGSKVIVASSESTVGYFRFDLTTMQAERVSPEGEVYNASDLANGNLLFEKKKKDKKDKDEEVTPEAKTEKPEIASRGEQTTEAALEKGVISVYPNPVTNGVVKLGFSEQPAGRYSVQLLDISGRLVGAKEVTVNSESQVEEFRFPELNVKGNYLIRVTSEQNRVNVTNKIVVQ